ncbi:hypothetical protein TWF506_009781 [Arthrobotrys conoides]|uniref:Uncharacterized protein n=1 Tax=Arthrobotrys conoides TaxID=74498 RepID=A0AAN8N7F9_9PEZI
MHLSSTLLLLFIGSISAQERSGSSTTTVFETIHNTYTITRNIECDKLRLCENLAWSPIPDGPSPANNETTGTPSIISSPFDPDSTSPPPPTATASESPSATGEPFEFLLRGDGALSEHFIAFDDDEATVLVLSGKEPQYLQISAAGELGTSNATESTEVVFLRITNDTLPLERRQDDPNAVIYEIGDLLHAVPSEILSSDKLGTFYFSGTVLKLNWKGLIYTFYAVPRNVAGEYSLKMARLGTIVPSTFLPLNLNYMRRPSSSTTSSQSGLVPGTTSSTSRRSTSRSTGGSSDSNTSEPTSDTTTTTTTSTSDATSASTTSVDSSAVTLVYDIVTSFGYQSFCSEFLEYTGTVSLVSTIESSTVTGTIVTTSTSLFEKFIYTSTETIYTETTTNLIDATSTEEIHRRGVISQAPEIGLRIEPVQKPFLLATFNDAEISLGCSSAVPARETSTEYSTTTVTTPYASIDLSLETTTVEVSTASPLTMVGPLELTIPANGYWSIADESVTEFYHQRLIVIHDDLGLAYEQMTQASSSNTWFQMQWNEATNSYNAYWVYTYTTTTSGVPTTVTETRWLWYYVDRTDSAYIAPFFYTEEVAADKARVNPLKKAEFIVDSQGFAAIIGEPVIYICQWRGSPRATGYRIFTFWGLRTGFLEYLRAQVALSSDPDTEPFDCVIVSDRIQIIAEPGESLGKKKS